MSTRLDEMSLNKAIASLPAIEFEFRNLGLAITAETIKELHDEIGDGKAARENFQWLEGKVEAIEKLAHKELTNKFFLYVPPERAKYWPTQKDPYPFGSVVADKFPSAHFDIWHGALCQATSMSTASVFHMMRVLEIGLATLGKVFGVSLAHTNWEPAIAQIESKIRDMRSDAKWKALPDCKEQQEFYAQAASHFGILKDAWRNHTMHIRGQYTEAQADLIYENVKSFVQKLAERLSE